MDILKEAKALYDVGFAIHSIRPNSKAPVKSGWSGPVRDDWATFKRDYREGYGLGVRLGESSKVAGGYLANIDVDIKSSEPRHRAEALAALEKRFPQLIEHAPTVKTGYGLRLFVKTKTPMPSGKLAASSEETVVYMPSAEINKRQLQAVTEGRITKAQLDGGYRVRAAWELEFMSAGRQVVLPPSIHPETKKPYIWSRPLSFGNGLVPEVTVSGLKASPGLPAGTRFIRNFEPVDCDLTRLPDHIIAMIVSGDGVGDRSAAMLPVAIAMFKAGYNEPEILSVLTDKALFLGEVAYEHTKSRSRAVAAAWVKKYTLMRAATEADAARAFDAEVGVTPTLDEAGAAAQAAELLDSRKVNWQWRIKHTGKNGDGLPKSCIENVVLVLENAVSFQVFKRNLFTTTNCYGVDTPWDALAGDELSDDSISQIIFWLGHTYNFEPSPQTVIQAVSIIALRNSFHPVRDMLRALEPWDCKPRIDSWLKKYFGAKGSDEYLAQVLRKWLVAAVARVFVPGTKFDWLPILQGDQDMGKSQFGKILFGVEFFKDWIPSLQDKDAAIALQGYWCIEFAELATLRHNELEVAKSFITRERDHVRPAFGRLWVKLARQCVFLGTTNQDEHLHDDSGNRRFRTVEVGRLNFDALFRDRTQLWAEALFIYDNYLETTLDLESEANEDAKKIQATKMVADESEFMEDAILEFIKAEKLKDLEQRFNFNEFKLVNLFGAFGPLAKFKEDAKNLRLAAKTLHKLKGVRLHKMSGKWWALPL